MIVRNIEEIKGSEREVTAENNNWISRRLLLKRDGVGFSLNETIINEGTETYIWYKNHVEAVYCIEGEGIFQKSEDVMKHKIKIKIKRERKDLNRLFVVIPFLVIAYLSFILVRDFLLSVVIGAIT